MTLISDAEVTVEVADTVEFMGATIAMFILNYMEEIYRKRLFFMQILAGLALVG